MPDALKYYITIQDVQISAVKYNPRLRKAGRAGGLNDSVEATGIGGRKRQASIAMAIFAQALSQPLRRSFLDARPCCDFLVTVANLTMDPKKAKLCWHGVRRLTWRGCLPGQAITLHLLHG
jgi:hypothetical protein